VDVDHWDLLDTDVTNSTGWYQFSGLTAGLYQVNETLQDGWISTSPTPAKYEFTVGSGFVDVNDDFYNFQLGTKAGRKFNDLTGNGPSGDDTVLSGWTINLYKWDVDHWDLLDTDVTNSTGWYQFSGLTAGLYQVNETLQDGWISTSPTPAKYEFTVGSGFVDVNDDFYNFQLGTKAGRKFNDLTGNGPSGDDTVLSGWTINLYKWDVDHWDLLDTDVTNSTGWYQFSGLTAGLYQVNETLQDGWISTSPTPAKYEFTVGSGFVDVNDDFYNFQLGTKAGRKFNDLTGNGLLETIRCCLAGRSTYTSGTSTIGIFLILM